MSFVVLYDANVLYPSTLRDLLIRVAQAGLVQASGRTGSSMRSSTLCAPIDPTSIPRGLLAPEPHECGGPRLPGDGV